MPTQNPTDNITNQATNPLFGRGMDNSSGLPMDPARTASAQTSAYQRTEGVYCSTHWFRILLMPF